MTTTRQPDIGALFDPATRPNPYPRYGEMRDFGPFALLDGALTVLAPRSCATVPDQ